MGQGDRSVARIAELVPSERGGKMGRIFEKVPAGARLPGSVRTIVPGGTDRIINRFRHDTGDDSDQASISEYFFFP